MVKETDREESTRGKLERILRWFPRWFLQVVTAAAIAYFVALVIGSLRSPELHVETASGLVRWYGTTTSDSVHAFTKVLDISSDGCTAIEWKGSQHQALMKLKEPEAWAVAYALAKHEGCGMPYDLFCRDVEGASITFVPLFDLPHEMEAAATPGYSVECERESRRDIPTIDHCVVDKLPLGDSVGIRLTYRIDKDEYEEVEDDDAGVGVLRAGALNVSEEDVTRNWAPLLRLQLTDVSLASRLDLDGVVYRGFLKHGEVPLITRYEQYAGVDGLQGENTCKSFSPPASAIRRVWATNADPVVGEAAIYSDTVDFLLGSNRIENVAPLLTLEGQNLLGVELSDTVSAPLISVGIWDQYGRLQGLLKKNQWLYRHDKRLSIRTRGPTTEVLLSDTTTFLEVQRGEASTISVNRATLHNRNGNGLVVQGGLLQLGGRRVANSSALGSYRVAEVLELIP